MTTIRKSKNLTDLAKQANVTAATVSLALRNSPQLSAGLKEKIQQMATEQGFTPRAYNRREKPKPQKKYAHLGPVALLHYDVEDEDPVRDGIRPVILEKLNTYGVEYEHLNQTALRENPALLDQFAGALYYNDLKEVKLSEDFPAAQIFGWDPMGPTLDRITTNDYEVVGIALDFFREAGVSRAVIVWREDMVRIPDHPRITGFLSQMSAAGIEVTLMPFQRETPDFTTRMKEYIESGDDKIGFFGFNAVCGVKLCCALEALDLLAKYGDDRVLVCDRSILLSGFYPRPAMIDLNLPAMADRALEMLLWRLANPGAPGILALQSPKLFKI